MWLIFYFFDKLLIILINFYLIFIILICYNFNYIFQMIFKLKFKKFYATNLDHTNTQIMFIRFLWWKSKLMDVTDLIT